jgi:hypothetical protein
VCIPPEQDREIVEPGDDALQFDAVDEEDGNGRFVLADVVQEDVLNVLIFLGHFVLVLVRVVGALPVAPNRLSGVCPI